MKYTILGASGFIGSNLAKRLTYEGHNLFLPDRDSEEVFQKNLGNVFYCVGLTADFRSKPFETVHAHVTYLSRVLELAQFNSIVYLSSTRVYQHSDQATEDTPIISHPANKNDLYNISKIMGESLCLQSGKNAKVVRLSNVYGNDLVSENFLTSVLREAAQANTIHLKNSPQSSKDYISVNDVCSMLPLILNHGKSHVYNLASGVNITSAQILEKVRSLIELSRVEAPDFPTYVFPKIDTTRLRSEFSFCPRNVLDDIPELLRNHTGDKNENKH